MGTTYRTVGWAALMVSVAYLALAIIITLFVPTVFGDDGDLAIGSASTDPAIVTSARWLGAIEASLFLTMATGMMLVTLAVDRLAASTSLAARAHLSVGLAAAAGWLLVAGATATTHSSVVESAAPFDDQGRAAFFLALALDVTASVSIAAIASALWCVGTALHAAARRAIGTGTAVLLAIGGGLMLGSTIVGVPWGVVLLIPLFLALGAASLVRGHGAASRAAEAAA